MDQDRGAKLMQWKHRAAGAFLVCCTKSSRQKTMERKAMLKARDTQREAKPKCTASLDPAMPEAAGQLIS